MRKKKTNRERNKWLFEALRDLLHGTVTDRGHDIGLYMDLDWKHGMCKIEDWDDKIIAVGKDAEGYDIIVAEYKMKP